MLNIFQCAAIFCFLNFISANCFSLARFLQYYAQVISALHTVTFSESIFGFIVAQSMSIVKVKHNKKITYELTACVCIYVCVCLYMYANTGKSVVKCITNTYTSLNRRSQATTAKSAHSTK